MPQSANIQPPGLARLGAPFAMARPARPLQRTGACLLRALESMFCLRVLFESIWEATRSKRYRQALRYPASCLGLAGAIYAWGAIPKHNSHINELFSAYGHRVGFMKQLDPDTMFETKTPGDQLEADWRP